MDNIRIYLKLLPFLLMIILPFIVIWERKHMYGDAEHEHRRLIDRNQAEIGTRIKQSQADMNAALKSSSFSLGTNYPDTYSHSGGNNRKFLGAYYYSESLLARQYLPILSIIIMIICLPLIVGLLSQQVLPVHRLDVIVIIGGLWVFIPAYFLYLLRIRRKSYCLIYDDALLLSHHQVLWHPDVDFPRVLIQRQFIQWIGPCTAEVNRVVKNAKIPLINFVPMPYFPIYLEKWAMVYSDGIYQYSLIFYPSKEMIEAFRHHFPEQVRYHIRSILKPNKLR